MGGMRRTTATCSLRANIRKNAPSGLTWKFRFISAVAGLCALVAPVRAGAVQKAVDGKEYTEEVKLSDTLGTDYDKYLSDVNTDVYPEKEYILRPEDAFADLPPELKDGLDSYDGTAVLSEEGQVLNWRIDVDESGLYSLLIKYYPDAGNSAVIERALRINGEVPFESARHFVFYSNYTNKGVTEKEGFRKDTRGNELLPSQEENPIWTEAWFTDYLGFVQVPYSFYLRQGENLISLEGLRGNFWIGELTFRQPQKILSYKELERTYKEKGYAVYEGEPIRIQGEWSDEKSDPSLVPVSDRSSPTTDPNSPFYIRYNCIGGESWKSVGQKITWKVEVPQSALYQLGIKYRQNYTRGLWVTRKLTIDGEVPFSEAADLRFQYGTDWENYLLGKDAPYYIYLEKGTHRISLEVTIGSLGEQLSVAQNSITRLNYAYRQLLMIIGSNPDRYRDYQLQEQAPEALEIIREQAKVIRGISDDLFRITGKRGQTTAIVTKLASQLESFAKKPDLIQRRWMDFKSNLSSFAEWFLNIQEQPLQIDYLMLLPRNSSMPRASGTFLQKVWKEVAMLFGSFVVDYNSIGDIHNKKEAITVWVQSGRDQAHILRRMIDSMFASKYRISVNVQLVQGVLLQAIVSDRAPDVALGLFSAEPMNLFIRGALTDLSYLPGFKDVSDRFYPSALVPFTFRNQVCALPETQTFPMMFVRTDIMKELGLEIPQTWDDILNVLPIIQSNNMDIGIEADPLKSFTMFLYQNGGQLYDKDGRHCLVDSEVGIKAFKQFVSFFMDYGTPQYYNFVNRFRTGEMPLAISDYSAYNTLSVFAPEIRGLWKMVPVPGTEKENGEVDRSAAGTVTGCVLIKNSRHQESAWQFLTWWTSAEVQHQFGKEMESLLGPAARYATANKKAMENLPWSVEELNNLTEQWNWTKGNPEVPGGYFTSRHLTNAFRRTVYHQKEDPRDVLTEYVITINQEIKKKRQELKIDTE